MLDLTAELASYGITKESVRLFDSPRPELLDYLDLVQPSTLPVRPAGVAESQGRPLLYFLNEAALHASPLEETAKRKRLRRALASRGQRAYLAVIRPGEIQVVPVAFEQEPQWQTYRAGTNAAKTFFARLAFGDYEGPGDPAESDVVFTRMFELLMRNAEELTSRVEPSDVISLFGRALFFRFLCDRQIVTKRNLHSVAPGARDLRSCFDNAEHAAATCRWLDKTFNGDFLPLTRRGSRTFFEDIGRHKPVFEHLGAILHGADPAGPHYQYRIWQDLDFAHVPVGLLSQVYEKLCWQWDRENSKATSVHYTPRTIAATLVEEAFDGLRAAGAARVLDPACGAGIFLVLALRRLYRERWLAGGQRPDTREIRRLLNEQITGFDISEPALRLAALSLYLTAIELDPEPVPPSKLRFRELRDRVLFNHRPPQKRQEGIVIGSLGSHVPKAFDGAFDIVLGNPPWTSLKKKESVLARELTEVSQAVVERCLGPEWAKQYANPDGVPDLPFVLRSTEWCRPDGRIAMVLPARLLLKQGRVPRQARETLLQMIEVNAIINGANLSDTNVWPKMGQPFMLFFARCRRPKPGHELRLITLVEDRRLNQRGEIRIDAKSARRIEVEATRADPWLWKALTIGTTLDLDVVRKVHAKRITLGELWRDCRLASGKGYRLSKEAPRQMNASFLRGLPNLNDTDLFRFEVHANLIEGSFTHSTAERVRKPEIYEPPLVLVKRSPGDDRQAGWAWLCSDKVAYSESFIGYSAAGHPEGLRLLRYLHLIVHSLLWQHHALVTSALFGAERRVFYKEDLDDFPVVSLAVLTRAQKDEVDRLSGRLVHEDLAVFDDIDRFVGRLYGLDDLDLEVVRDTLAVGLPYEASRTRACTPPTSDEREAFRKRLASVLAPLFGRLGRKARVRVVQDELTDGASSPFGLIEIAAADTPLAVPSDLVERQVLPLAHETGATRVVLQVAGGLVVGLLNQYRFWTPSRARLLAAEIVRDHFGAFE